MTDDAESRELALARPRIAESLDRAEVGQLVYAGGDGNVMSPRRAKRRQVAALTVAGASFALGIGVSIAYMPLMLIPYGLLGLRLGTQLHATRALNRVAVLMQDDRLADARALAQPIADAWWVPRTWRGIALYRLGWCAAYDRDYDQALALIRAAQQKISPRMVHARAARYGEVQVLVSLGRLPEARAAFAKLGPVPTGELLRVMHWETELYVAFGEGKHAIDDDALHDRVRKALAMNRSRLLLILLAWAHEHSGDAVQMGFLLGQAETRKTAKDRLPAAIESWLAAHPAPAMEDDL